MFGKIALNLALSAVTAGAVFAALAVSGMKKPRKTIAHVKEGDMVQWDSRGTFVFPQPRKVTNVNDSAHGIYVFVEGSGTGIPIEQIVVMKRTGDSSPDVNPT